MNQTMTLEEMRDEYLARVESLYAQVRAWIRAFDPRATLEEEDTLLREEPVAPYKAKILVIERPGYKPVRLIPRGRWIIGAEGRIDMKSDLGIETLVHVSDGDPHVRMDLLTENGKLLEEEEPVPAAGDVAEGWVFVQNRQIGMLPRLDAALFRRLLEVLGR